MLQTSLFYFTLHQRNTACYSQFSLDWPTDWPANKPTNSLTDKQHKHHGAESFLRKW